MVFSTRESGEGRSPVPNEPQETPEKLARADRGRIPLQVVLGGILAGFVVGAVLLSFVWTPWDPTFSDVSNRLTDPSSAHWFGTDHLGRDLLTVTMLGGRTSLSITLISTAIGAIFGVLLALGAAGAPPAVAASLARLADIGIALPSILIALVLATALGPGSGSMIIAISVWFVPVTARVLIGPARQVLSFDFIEASRSQGRGQFFILLRHITPNIAPLIIVQISIMFGAGVLIESSLSFLGVGVQPPTPSWGRILNEAQPLLSVAPHYLLLPGAVIVAAILGFNLLGDGLRVWLDPQQSQRGTD